MGPALVPAGAPLLLAMGCGANATTPTDPPGPVTRVEVTASQTPYVGAVLPLKAVATRENGSTHDVTRSAVWTTSAPAVASVAPGGELTVMGFGQADIRAAFSGASGTLLVEAVVPPTVTGRVIDRISGSAISGSTIRFGSEGFAGRAEIAGGAFNLPLPPGEYDVTIEGPTHVTHVSRRVSIAADASLRFSVIQWGSGRFGATYDETFHKYFHQVARVSLSSAVETLRKWVIPPSEIYLVEGHIAPEEFARLRAVVDEINAESVSDMWCGLTGPLPVRTGTDEALRDGRIVVLPTLDGPWLGGGAGGWTIRSGSIQMSVRNRITQEYFTHAALKRGLLHEFFHVVFAFHLCGGPLGTNPFGFGRSNCPYPQSVMANLGDGPPVFALSAQDRLAACLVYHSDVLPANDWPDTNPPPVR